MKRALFAVATAGLIYAATPVAAEATLLLPHQGVTTATPDYLTEVRWRRCWRDSRGRTRCHTCWRDRRGRTHCR
jgi:hypothetical protein